MAIHTFAAIDIGSYELCMEIFEVSRSKGIREIDYVVRKIDLGSDTYSTGKLSLHHIQEVRDVLRDYRKLMDTYRVTEYQAYGTSAIREMTNASIILSQWEEETGIHIDVLSNSEQRFLDYKSLAYRGENFEQAVKEGCAVVDIGGSSLQISLFANGVLQSTQNLRLGVLRVREQIRQVDAKRSQIQKMISEIVNSQMQVFTDLYLADRKIPNIIVVDDYISSFMEAQGLKQMEEKSFTKYAEMFAKKTSSELSKKFRMSEDNIFLLGVSGVIMGCIMKAIGAEKVYAPGVTLTDGIVYEYAEQRRILPPSHNFEEDIIACARNISARYKGNVERGQSLEQISVKIFDATKKIHGLGERERLLLRLSCILHDCGKFVSIANVSDCSYNIIRSTEIIGISHIEREIVANVVMYNHSDFVYYEERIEATDLNRDDYLTLTKLTAILRLANGLDRTHKKKLDDTRISVHDDQLVITAKSSVDLTLEKGLFQARAGFFAEVFGITPVIRQK
jgi:exopolyphosphatase / guanosine-5'-triphosphate,3'-diphosphate pyrophosphatase